MPVFAVEILHGNSSTLSLLTGASGLRALCSGIYLSYGRSAIELEKIIAIAPVIFGITLITFSLSNNFGFSLMTITIVGYLGCIINSIIFYIKLSKIEKIILKIAYL
ncbi:MULTISPECIES: MFS transporter [Nostoc]|uniref:MFS transporter n=1 Tax=Nostoc paludosum FACHB-159 TaxID=2692908 RepID=A0ABR8KG03_9NOSO|nr:MULTISPECIES: MFS transporter [Nostoc]MBD2682154.1 MFS transporter [Nostoc sp. FACHB-857]MBD2738482.1 MFS transporter [Nostoc paludosum FACHB-159]